MTKIKFLPYNWGILPKVEYHSNYALRVFVEGITSEGNYLIVKFPQTHIALIRSPQPSLGLVDYFSSNDYYTANGTLVVKNCIPHTSAHTLLDNTEFITVIDPCGPLPSFFANHPHLHPYRWIQVDRYLPIDIDKQHQLAILALDYKNCEDLGQHQPLFFKIQIYTPHYKPQSRNDKVYCITVKDQKNVIILTTECIDPSLIVSDVTVITCLTEAELIQRFRNMIQPYHLLVSYGGCSFDMPYLQSRFGFDELTNVHLDLKDYCKRFFPHLASHKLSTVTDQLLGTRSHLVDYYMMNDAIARNDARDIALTLNFTIINIELIAKLYQNQCWRLWDVCNRLRISIQNLLYTPWLKLIEMTVLNIQPDQLLHSVKYSMPQHFESSPGIYQNINLYDISQSYLNAVPAVWRQALKDAPPDLLWKLLTTCYGPDFPLTPASAVPAVRRTYTTIASQYHIPNIPVLQTFEIFVVTKECGYVGLDSNDQLHFKGQDPLCYPACEALMTLLRYRLRGIQYNIKQVVQTPRDVALKIDVPNITQTIPNSVEYKLAIDYNDDIVEQTRVAYVETLDGPKILSTVVSLDEIDWEFYQELADDYLSHLEMS